jgi:RES domain-containing protein
MDLSGTNRAYHVALTFAEQDRGYVSQVAAILRYQAINVFYDHYEISLLWGKNMLEFMDELYGNNTHFVIMFISEAYVAEMAKRHERRIVLETALGKDYDYLLPARFDNAKVPGLPVLTIAIYLKDYTPEQFCAIVIRKLTSHGFSFAARVPADGSYLAYRITTSRYAKDLSRLGASLTGGRWNKRGFPVLYASDSFLGGLLETIIHSAGNLLFNNRVSVCLKIPMDVSQYRLEEKMLKPGWQSDFEYTTSLGQILLDSTNSCILSLPSATGVGRTLLLNPDHPDFKKISIFKVEDIGVDPRQLMDSDNNSAL